MTGSVQGVYERWQGYKSNFVLRDAELNITRLANLRAIMKSETPKMYVHYIYDGTKDDEDAVAYFKRWVPQVDVVQFTLRLPVLKGENAIQVQKTEEYSDVPELFSSGSGKVPCGAVGSFSISSDGTLTPCSSGMGEKQLALGNLKEKSFGN